MIRMLYLHVITYAHRVKHPERKVDMYYTVMIEIVVGEGLNAESYMEEFPAFIMNSENRHVRKL